MKKNMAAVELQLDHMGMFFEDKNDLEERTFLK